MRSTRTFARNSHTSFPHCLGSRQPGRRRSSTSATAVTARCVSCSKRLTATTPLVLVLDDLHWATRDPWNCSARCCAARRPRQCSSRWRSDRVKHRSASPLRSSVRTARGRCSRVEVGALTRERGSRASRRGGRRRRRDRPLCRRAAATRSISSSSPDRSGSQAARHGVRSSRPTDLDVPPAVAVALGRGARSSVRRRTAGAGGGSGGRRPVRARACGGRRGDARGGGAGGHRRAAEARPRSRDGGAAPLSLPAPARSTGGLRVDLRRLATGRARAERRAARRSRCAGAGARASRRALARQGDEAAVATLREAARRPRCAPQRAPRPGLERAAAPAGATAPAELRVELLLGPREGARRDGAVRRRARRAAREHRTGPDRVGRRYGCVSRRPVPGSSTCSAATSRRTTRLASAVDGLSDPELVRGGDTDDRAGDGRLLSHGLRADARVGRASAQHCAAARRPAADRGRGRTARLRQRGQRSHRGG